MTGANWLKLYESAVLETDDAILARRIAEAEEAMSSRLREIDQNPEKPSGELTILQAAAKALQVLREERLHSGNIREQRAESQD